MLFLACLFRVKLKENVFFLRQEGIQTILTDQAIHLANKDLGKNYDVSSITTDELSRILVNFSISNELVFFDDYYF